MLPGGAADFQKGELVSCKACPSFPAVMARRSGRGKVGFQVKGGGGWSAHGKPRVIVQAEGQSHEGVKGEALADDKSLGSQSGKVRRWRAQGAVQGLMELWWTSPIPGHLLMPSHPVPSSPVPRSLSLLPCTFLLFLMAPLNPFSFGKTMLPSCPINSHLVFP